MLILRDRQSTLASGIDGWRWRCRPCRLHLEVISWIRWSNQRGIKRWRESRQQATGEDTRRHRPRSSSSSFEAPKDHATSDSIPLQPPTSLLHTTCTYKRVPSLPIPASMHEALILAKRWKVGCFLRLLIIPPKTQRSSGSGWPSSIMPSSGVQRQYYAVRNNSGVMIVVPRTVTDAAYGCPLRASWQTK